MVAGSDGDSGEVCEEGILEGGEVSLSVRAKKEVMLG